jgi:hypothetical protein
MSMVCDFMFSASVYAPYGRLCQRWLLLSVAHSIFTKIRCISKTS